MELKFRVETVCGRALFYPRCEKSKELLKIIRSEKAFSEKEIASLKVIGFKVKLEELE